MARGGGLRPASSLGHSSEKSLASPDDESGEWVTIVSKFHFVDLAGSERVCASTRPFAFFAILL